ncbi:MAG: type II toxin-antitoxin system HicB family antitoxin [Candidatus Absconditabacterales bacterium]
MHKAVYSTGKDGIILAKIPGYVGFFSQGDNFEDARENLQDAIESVIMYKILQKDDKLLIQEISDFIKVKELAYA